MSKAAKDEVWFLDSRCKNHMCGNKEWLFDFDENVRESIKLKDDSKMLALGRGNLKLDLGHNKYVLPTWTKKQPFKHWAIKIEEFNYYLSIRYVQVVSCWQMFD